MKKFLITLAAMAGLTLNASAITPGEDNGLGIRLSIGSPGGDSHLYENGYYRHAGSVDGIAFGLSLDNRWYVYHNDKVGIAIQARWLDANFTTGKFRYKSFFYTQEEDINSINCGLLGVGPMFTYYMNDNMAIDAYYNIMPAVCYTKLSYDDDYVGGSPEKYLGVGVTQHVGAAFRWKMLQAGLEYRFGKLKGMSEVDNDDKEMDGAMNMLKFNIGVKF